MIRTTAKFDPSTVQMRANLVELEKSCKMSLQLQKIGVDTAETGHFEVRVSNIPAYRYTGTSNARTGISYNTEHATVAPWLLVEADHEFVSNGSLRTRGVGDLGGLVENV